MLTITFPAVLSLPHAMASGGASHPNPSDDQGPKRVRPMFSLGILNSSPAAPSDTPLAKGVVLPMRGPRAVRRLRRRSAEVHAGRDGGAAPALPEGRGEAEAQVFTFGEPERTLRLCRERFNFTVKNNRVTGKLITRKCKACQQPIGYEWVAYKAPGRKRKGVKGNETLESWQECLKAGMVARGAMMPPIPPSKDNRGYA